jgi:hypothetical protein
MLAALLPLSVTTTTTTITTTTTTTTIATNDTTISATTNFTTTTTTTATTIITNIIATTSCSLGGYYAYEYKELSEFRNLHLVTIHFLISCDFSEQTKKSCGM